MNSILYFIIKLYSYYPLKWLNILSWKFTLLLRIFGYRKNVVLTNLSNAYPHKSKKEINKIANDFYRYFGRLLAESLKLFSINKSILSKRVSFKNDELINDYLNNNRDVIVVMGHYGNWEWGLLATSMHFNNQMVAIYKELSSNFWNTKMKSIRGQLSARMVSMKESVRFLLKKENNARLIGIVGDQTPSSEEINYWINFLNQKTPVFLGTEKLAKKLDSPVFFATVSPKSHGYYEIVFELITEHPKETKEGEITNLHSIKLEEDINKNPAFWLWSHRRWKHQK
ncbi:MAG: lysophospholipid acyltransferase family protein [Flavobacteriales bacterium]|nr:lysophospholipid acyltransferase family protein [Flavobacteriales bacterium]